MNVESGFQGLQLTDLWGIARRRRRYVILAAGLTTLAAYWIAMALPNEYESSATVLVEPQSIDPDLVEAGVADSDLTKRLHLMTAQILSRPRLSRIIDELGLYAEESKHMLREEVIGLMRSKVAVEPVIPELERGSGARRTVDAIDTFKIIFRDDNAAVARDVSQRLANDFIEQHIDQRISVSQKSLEFVEDELERISENMRDIEARIATIKADNPGRLPEDMGANQRRLERLIGDLGRVQQQYDLARSDEAYWRSQVLAEAESYRPHDDASPVRKLQVLELQIAEYAAKGFTEKHPDVIKAKLEAEQIRRQIEAGVAEDEQQEAPPTAYQQRAEGEANRAHLRSVSAQEELQRLRDSIDELQVLLAETPRVAEQLDGLQREYQSQLTAYQSYIMRQQEAGVQANMERRQLGEQFRVLESAFIAPEPSSPNRPFIILLGAFFGMALGGGLALVLETVDSSIHTSRQLQSSLRLPVLASIPTIELESDRIRLRRSRIVTALASTGVVLFVLVGGFANYVWVNGAPPLLVGERRPETAPARPAPASPAAAAPAAQAQAERPR